MDWSLDSHTTAFWEPHVEHPPFCPHFHSMGWLPNRILQLLGDVMILVQEPIVKVRNISEESEVLLVELLLRTRIASDSNTPIQSYTIELQPPKRTPNQIQGESKPLRPNPSQYLAKKRADTGESFGSRIAIFGKIELLQRSYSKHQSRLVHPVME